MGFKNFMHKLFNKQNRFIQYVSDDFVKERDTEYIAQEKKKTLIKKINVKLDKIIKSTEKLFDNDELINIFDNFLVEKSERVLDWSCNLFLVDIDDEDYGLVSYWNLWKEQLESYIENTSNEEQKVIFKILRGSYDSAILSSGYVDDNDNLLLFKPVQICDKIKNSNYQDSFVDDFLEFSILDKYKDIFEFRDALVEAGVMTEYSSIKFFLLLQHRIMKKRAEYGNKLAQKLSVSGKYLGDFDNCLEMLTDSGCDKESIIEIMTLVFGNYNMMMFISNGSIDYILDDGLSSLKLNYWNLANECYCQTTEEIINKHFEKIKKKKYIERLSKGVLKDSKIKISDIDLMSGYEFEKFISKLFQKMGYKAYATQESNDQGVDVIAEKGDVKVAIQTKCYNGTVGNSAIQEIVAGMKYYEADKAMVITNSTFTKSAVELAKKNNVQLWDRKTLIEKINEVM